jgi:hypothetical protein
MQCEMQWTADTAGRVYVMDEGRGLMIVHGMKGG